MGGSGVLPRPSVRDEETSTTNGADQRVISQYSLAAHVTRALRTHNADMFEQAGEQRAAEQLPKTHHN